MRNLLTKFCKCYTIKMLQYNKETLNENEIIWQNYIICICAYGNNVIWIYEPYAYE